MSFISGRSTLLRSAVVGGTLVGSLVSAGSASAALGTAQSPVFTNRPNLQSVTVDATGIIGSFKFDKPVVLTGATAAANLANFRFGSYRASVGTDNTQASAINVSSSDPTVVLVTFNGTAPGGTPSGDNIPDFDNQSFGDVAAGAVRGNGTTQQTNLGDATRVTAAGGESGTRGHTTGPDLQSVIIDSDNNRIFYVFDELVDGGRLATAVQDFGFTDSSGNQVRATGLTGASDNNVIAQFTVGADASDVDNAREAFYSSNGVAAAVQSPVFERGTQGRNSGVPNVSVPVPGQTQTTTVAPKLVSANLEVDSGTIVYTFDQPVRLNGTGAGVFQAVESNGDVVANTGTATIVGGNTVRATFNTSQFTEHEVFASVAPNAVTSVNNNNAGGTAPLPNTPGGKPIGGNAGAKATGYTTAPDALSATFNRTSGQATVLFDSRITTTNAAGFQLVDQQGNVVGAQPTTATTDTSSQPIQARVVLQFAPEQLAAASYIRVIGQTTNGAAGGGFGFNGTFAARGTISQGSTAAAPGGSSFLNDEVNVESIIVPTATTRKFSVKK